MNGTEWWRWFSDVFQLSMDTPDTIVDGISFMLVPCHESWAWKVQQPYLNDNRKET